MAKSLTIPPLTEDLAQVLIDAATIERRVDELAFEISKDYQKARHALEMDLAELDTYFLKNDTVLSSSFIIT